MIKSKKKVKSKLISKKKRVSNPIGIFSFTPLASKSNFIQVEMMNNIKNKNKNIIYLGLQKQNFIDKVLKDNNLDIQSESFAFNSNNVKDFVQFVKIKLKKLKLNSIYMLHGPWFQKTPHSMDYEIEKTIKNNQFNNFISGEEIRKDILMMVANKLYNINYFCVDPLEIDITKSKYFIPKNIKKFCFYEYPDSDNKSKFHYSDFYIDLSKNKRDIVKKKINDKIIKFYFSGNLKQRSSLIDKLCPTCDFFKDIIGKGNFKINIYSTAAEKKQFRHSYDEYLNFLNNSKYTLVIPSNNIKHFSYLRFMEAIIRECIPFVYEECNIDIIKKSHPKIHSFIKSNDLIVREGIDIHRKINDLNYLDLVKQTKNFF